MREDFGDSQGYRIVVLSEDDPERVAILGAEISNILSNAGLTRASVDISHDPNHVLSGSRPDEPTTALVILGGRATGTDAIISAAAQACRGAMRVCVPVFDPAVDFNQQVPEAVHELNGVPWPRGQSPAEAANVILRLLGLTEAERRVFISYRRSDASALANQLRYSLIDAGWEVFLDRFSVPPAAVFQQQLDRDLADKAFVLLIESPEASTSQWVEHEIAFAHMHKFGIMSLALPETNPDELFPAVLSDLRMQLQTGDVSGEVGARQLRQSAIDRVLNEIDLRHARAFQQRREILMLDAAEELTRAGFDVKVIGGWALLGSNASSDEVVLTTPRAPEARDLLAVDALRRKIRSSGRTARGWIVHPLEDIDRDRALLIGWLSRHRKVGPTPVMLLGSRIR